MKSSLLIVTFFSLISCNNGHRTNSHPSPALTEDSIPPEASIQSPGKEVSDFSLQYGDSIITLKAWDNQVNLFKILGKPKLEKVKVLGDGADTHKGSIIKTLIYDGLEMEFFSPKQNSKQFWILTMDITSSRYSTNKNITIGNTVKEIKASYPGIEIAPDGRTDPENCAYEISKDDNYLRFEVKNGIVQQIRIYHEIP